MISDTLNDFNSKRYVLFQKLIIIKKSNEDALYRKCCITENINLLIKKVIVSVHTHTIYVCKVYTYLM